MELNTHICTQLVEKAKAFAQITLDDDYIVRDNKPDVIRIIYTKGDVLLEDAKVGNQVVWITGKLRFDSLYQSDDETHRLESVSGEILFQEKLVMDEVEDGDEVSIDVKIEDLSVGLINSRKLVVRSVLNISVTSVEEQDIAITCAPSEETDYEQKTGEEPLMCLVENKRDVMRIQKEVLLPNSRENIGQLVFFQVDYRNEEIILQDDKMQIQMDAQLWVLYRSESTGEYEYFETVVPLSGEMYCNRLHGDEIFWAKIRPVDVEVEARGDYDGESRMLGLDFAFSVQAQIYREEMCEMLQDAYSLDAELVLEREYIPMNALLMKNISKVRLMEQAELEPNQEKILQICGSSGNITIDRVQKRENGIQVEGILTIHILYNTTENNVAFAHTYTQIPFEQFIDMEGFSENSLVWMDEKLEQLQVNLLDNSEYEVKATVQIGVLAMAKLQISNITSITETPLDVDALQRQPGMIGCVRKEGEDLWDIAKKYHATASNIIEIGNNVLVVKQVR